MRAVGFSPGTWLSVAFPKKQNLGEALALYIQQEPGNWLCICSRWLKTLVLYMQQEAGKIGSIYAAGGWKR